MKIKQLALLCLLFGSSLNTWAEQQPYLYEQLKNPVYQKTFNALFKKQHNLEPWLKNYLKNRDGVDTPSENRTVEGKTYEFYQLCEPHNCGGSNLYVFFEQGGTHAWALLTKDNSQRFFGNPNSALQQALQAEIHH